MTPEEAIKRIKNHNELHSRAEKHFALHITKALNLAVEALEKQTPKKPIEIFPFHHCPSCNTVVSEHNKFCSECGQALDRSDEE